jgi:AcrR family transcriptional regulator
MTTTQSGERRTRSDGERSRLAILQAAARLATVDGLDGLSIGQLADHIGMSKSGLYAHFRSKQELQLATVDTAQEIFEQDVIAPGLAAESGLRRVQALCDRFLAHVESDVFPGGCFFASTAAELDTRPGPVKERIADVVRGWSGLISTELHHARTTGELTRAVDIDQLTFQLNALLLQANNLWVLQGDHRVFDWARRGIENLLESSSSPPTPTSQRSSRSPRLSARGPSN